MAPCKEVEELEPFFYRYIRAAKMRLFSVSLDKPYTNYYKSVTGAVLFKCFLKRFYHKKNYSA